MTTTLLISENLLDDARLAEGRGEKANAESLYKQALAKRKEALGDSDASVGEYQHLLGHLYLVSGDLANAETTLRGAVEVVEKALYAGHARLAPILDDLADTLLKQDRFTDAEPILTRLLDIVDKTMNGDHRYVFSSMHKLAYVHRKLGKFPEAEKLLLKALKTIDTPLGPAEEFRFDLALVYQEMGKNDEADNNFKDASYGFEQRKNYPRLAESLEAYAAFLTKLGKSAQAKRASQLATHIRETTKQNQQSSDLFSATLLRA
ncbi:MAG TPA: tetratricopeptide repeat protein [Planktothrix sp.]|jgi:tetratricopeptide (TPR) repeat protein